MITVVFILSYVFKIYEHPFWIDEGGVIETLSAIGYFVCALLMLTKGGWEYIKKYHYFFLAVIFFGLRELDFDKKFTTMGVFKSKFYVSDSVPGIEKLVGLLVILIVLYLVFSIIRHHAKGFFTQIKNISPVHIGILTIIVFLIVAKTLDGIARKLRDFNVHIDEQASEYFLVAEEVLELGVSLMVISTFLMFLNNSSSKNKVQ